ncbi:hypothetical protein FS837_010205 [Tulasnella sp. UAMH 9824]|nr:hypothetical protein FS837_010205 [Tulasnella sp. UAMH 9824]
MHCTNSRYAPSGLKAPPPEAETRPSISSLDFEVNMATRAQVVIKKRRHLLDPSHEESIHVIHFRKKIKIRSRFEAQRLESIHVLRRDTKLFLYLQTTPRTTKDISFFTAQEGQDGFLPTEITSGCSRSTAHKFFVVSLEIRYEGYAAGCGVECLEVAHRLPLGLIHCVIVLKLGGDEDGPLVRRALARKLEGLRRNTSLKVGKSRNQHEARKASRSPHRVMDILLKKRAII